MGQLSALMAAQRGSHMQALHLTSQGTAGDIMDQNETGATRKSYAPVPQSECLLQCARGSWGQMVSVAVLQQSRCCVFSHRSWRCTDGEQEMVAGTDGVKSDGSMTAQDGELINPRRGLKGKSWVQWELNTWKQRVTAVKVVVKEPETKQTQRGKRVGFVLVHAGAGYHSESKAKEYKHVCKRACQKAIEKLQAGALATDAVTAALIELEVRISDL
ncbi:hypothetical protein EK904_013489 [Melospiza melodia maxima]|nr:hypothetical protein EK904_013489 [Melospiza melodia maxima]